MRKPPSLRNNNGVIQVRVRIDGVDRFINRLGRYSDSVSIARAKTLSAQIWEDYCSGKLDYTLDSYRPVPQDAADQSLVAGLTDLFRANGQGRVRHALRLVQTYGRPLRTRSEVAAFIRWMEDRGIAPQTRVGVLSTFRRVNPEQAAFTGHRIRIPGRSVFNDILSRSEVSRILEHLKTNDSWYYPIFFLWLSTGLRNSELIGLTWDCIDWEQSECKITKSLKRREDSNVLREWGDTKNKKHRIVPLTTGVLKMLQEHQKEMQEMNLYQPEGLLFLTKRTQRNLYDAVLERAWRRTLKSCGIKYRKLYSQRHTFLSHTLASGNSPADVAAIAGHRLEVLLRTYAKPTGKLKLVEWE